MTQNTDNEIGQISLGLYLAFFGLLLGCAYFVVRPFFEWNEGYFAVFETIIICLFLIVFAIVGIINTIYICIKTKGASSSLDIGFLILILVMVGGSIFIGSFAIKPLYYTIFETKTTTTTYEYYLKSFENQKRAGAYEYYLYFDDDTRVKINKTTYQKLRLNNEYSLKLTYKPKAEILYDLQISLK
ncbi:Uncharacterised protein [Moraxella lacunata]|uniref:Uncharacterized protein n=1 Tax=Moraxella lacunata TaxID=477 RepID=A0A378T8G4_MORLA|nr:hypothetical protein [Moraxella lacunata]STZ56437.1 Uncharacterised protein [Moraxella lacunata]